MIELKAVGEAPLIKKKKSGSKWSGYFSNIIGLL